ncbi:ATP-binding protein [Corallococcus interemptor]|uniref:AAA family ATPase n=1 Tax=Corallococcus TaxID=83461 RepID=UPI001CBE66F7|nr:ATP-binding protein [Corallococcus sp. AS-1-6]MBZ4377079.1 ATP-binding protein [Corallococcus sp. AS-1-6]
MIEKVQFRNFKAYRSLDLELEPFTVLVGPNASGKTTLLEGLQLLAILFRANPRIVADKSIPERYRSAGSKQSPELKYQGRWDGVPVEVNVYGSRTSTPKKSSVADDVAPYEGAPKVLAEAGSQSSALDVRHAFRQVLRTAVLLRFELRKLAEPSYSEDQVPGVASDGAGLASTLAFLKLSREELFENVEAALRQVVPSVRRIRIERAPVEQNSVRTIALDGQTTHMAERRTLWGNRIVLDMKGAQNVPADSVGEGTLMVLGLLTVLLGPQKPRLVLLDDIELSLHPTAQGELIKTLRAIQRDQPGLQIVATSHSPFILNYLKSEEIRMTFLGEDGFARCEKLTAHPEFEKWKDLMSPGEFWSTVGENWIGKVPASAPHE